MRGRAWQLAGNPAAIRQEDWMKKLCIILFAALFVIVSCSTDFEIQKPGTITVKNDSDFDVTYQIGNMPAADTVTPGEDRTYNLPLYSYMKSYDNDKRVTLKTEYPNKNDIRYTFNNRNSYTVKVNNTLEEDAALSADGWMDEMEGIPPGAADDALHTGKIYTDTPTFTVTATSGFPAEAAYTLLTEEDTFMVTISWGSSH